jgi:hypothetical protein
MGEGRMSEMDVNYCYCGEPHPDDLGHDLRACVHCEALCRPPRLSGEPKCGCGHEWSYHEAASFTSWPTCIAACDQCACPEFTRQEQP